MSKIIIETHDLVIKKEKKIFVCVSGFSFAFEIRQSINFGRVLPPFQTKIDLIYHKSLSLERKKDKEKNKSFFRKNDLIKIFSFLFLNVTW